MKNLLTLFTATILMLTLAFMPALAETVAAAPTPEAADEAAVEATEAPAEDVEASEEELNWFQSVAAGIKEMPWYSALVIVALIALLVLLSVASKQKWTSRQIAFAAMCIAIAFVLSNIRLFRMPQGGSVSPAAKLPLILFALACGPVPGVVVGCAYGLLQLLLDPYVIHPVQLLVDYPLASAAVALCCLVYVMPLKNESARLVIAVLLGYLGSYVMAVLSGVVFFAEYAGEQNALIYSLSYNISYTGVEALICAAVACVPGMHRLVKLIKK